MGTVKPEEVVDLLAEHGVDTVFCVPGAQTLPLNDEMKRYGDDDDRDDEDDASDVEYVMTRHESAAAYAAWGYAETSRGSGNEETSGHGEMSEDGASDAETGEEGTSDKRMDVPMAATLVVPGAGDTYALNGLKNAYNDGTPLLHIAIETEPHLRGGDAIHETPPETYDPVLKENVTVQTSGGLLHKLERAIRLARTPPTGPVRIGIPKNFLEEDGQNNEKRDESREDDGESNPEEEATTEEDSAGTAHHASVGMHYWHAFEDVPEGAVENAVEHFGDAEKPLVVAGGGIRQSGATEALESFAKKFCIPVVTTNVGRGKGVFPEDGGLYAGSLYFARVEGGDGTEGDGDGTEGDGDGTEGDGDGTEDDGDETDGDGDGMEADGEGTENDEDGTEEGDEEGFLLESADTVLAVGTDLDAVTTDGWDQPLGDDLIHVVLHPGDLGRGYEPDVGIVADAKAVLEELEDQLEVEEKWDGPEWAEEERKWIENRLETAKAYGEVEEADDEAESDDDGERTDDDEESVMTSADVVDVVGGISADPPDSDEQDDSDESPIREADVVAVGVGGFGMWMRAAYRTRAHQQYLQVGSWASMGSALPGAVGASIADPDRDVVAMVGDGGLLMALAELHTVATYGLPVVTVVVNNGDYGIISSGADDDGDGEADGDGGPEDGGDDDDGDESKRRYGWPGLPVEFTDVAKGLRIDYEDEDGSEDEGDDDETDNDGDEEGSEENGNSEEEDDGKRIWRTETPEEFEDALRDAIQADGPALVEVMTDPEEEQAHDHFDESDDEDEANDEDETDDGGDSGK